MKTFLSDHSDGTYNKNSTQPAIDDGVDEPIEGVLRAGTGFTRVRCARCFIFVVALTVVLSSQNIFATNLYWDINGAIGGAGGSSPTGTWDNSTPNWTTSSAGTSPTEDWLDGNVAVFSAGTDASGNYTILLSGTQSPSGVTFQSGIATLSGGTLSLTGAGDVAVTGTKGVINSAIIGLSGLTKTGSGELVLQGANTFTGNLTNRAGTLTLDNNLSAGGGAIVLNPSSPVILHSSLAGTTLSNNISLLGSASTIEMDADANNTLALSGVISGSHNWSANGPGFLELAGTNSFSGVLDIAQGTLLVAANGALGGTPSGSLNGVVVNSGATLSFGGGIDYNYNNKQITLNGTGAGSGAALDSFAGDNTFEGTVVMSANSSIGAQSGSSLTLVGPVSGGYNMTKVGAGEVVLNSGANAYASTLVDAGTLDIASGANGGSGLVTVSSGATFAGEGDVASGGIDVAGMISPGNGLPATLGSSSETWEAGGSFEWTINDAAGMAGDDPGYAELDISGGLAINATSGNPFIIHVISLDPDFDSPGDAANFDNTAVYNWTIATASGGISGFYPSMFSIDVSGFSNLPGNGAFILQQINNSIVLSFVQKPQITTGPASQTVPRYGNVTFSVLATGTATLHYQWLDPNNNPVGTDSPNFSINNLAFANAGTYTVVVSNLSGYTATATATLTVPKATPTAGLAVNNSPVTYDGRPQSAAVSLTSSSVPGSVSGILTGGASTQTSAGTYAVTANFVPDDSSDYQSLTGLAAGNFVISPATPVVTVTVGSYTYTGAAQGPSSAPTLPVSSGAVTWSYAGVAPTAYGPSATPPTAAGSYTGTATVAADSNNTQSSGSAGFTINKANPTIVVTPYSVTYDGAAHTATGTAKGVSGENLAGMDVSGTTHTAAGSYATDPWSFTDATGNYNSASGTVADAISQATPVVTVTVGSYTYTGAAQGPSSAPTLPVSSGAVTWSYAGVAPTAYGPSATPPTAAGSYTGTATVAADSNNTQSSGSAGFTINKANPTIVVTPYSVTYDGAAHTATGTAKGVSGENLAGMDVSGTTHTAAGSYATDPWSFTDATGNYNSASGTVADAISQATPVVTVTVGSYTYTGAAQGPSSAPTLPVSSGAVTWSYAGVAPTAYGPSATPPTAAGSYMATATVAADGNNYQSFGAAPFTIAREPLTVAAVTDTKVFDGTTTSSATPKITSGALQGTDAANFTQSYSTPDVGTNNKTLTPSGVVVDGNSGLNYAYTFVPFTTGTITAAPVPTVVYVDAKYAGLAPDTFVNWPDAGTGTNIVGYDAFATVQGGINGVASSGTVNVAAGTYTESGQIVIGESMSVVGADEETTIIKPSQDTEGNDDDGGAWLLVASGVNFNLSGVTLDGSGHKIWAGIRDQGSGGIGNCIFTNIQYEASGPSYRGTAITIYGTGNVDVTNCLFTEIGRVGVAPYGASTGTYSYNSYTGKGAGNWLDYAFLVQYGANVTLTNNQITGNVGVASVDGSESAGIAVWDDPGTVATLEGNGFTNNTSGLAIVVWSGGGSDPTVNVGAGNCFTGGAKGVDVQNAAAYYSGTAAAGSPRITFDASTFMGQSICAINLDTDISTGVTYDISKVVFEDLSGNVVTDNFAKQDLVYDVLNETDRGLLVWNANNVYVTPKSGSIQRGVNAVGATYTVNVDAGTFTEQLEIAKDITVTGQGATTILQSPASLALSYQPANGNTYKPVVYVHDTDNAVVQNFALAGGGLGNANNRFAGVAYYQAGGLVANLVIQGFEDNPIDGIQGGYGICAYADAAARTLAITGCNISGFQKNGIDVRGGSLVASISGNTVVGAGPVNFIAQNGVVFVGATGVIANNDISGFNYNPTYNPTDTEACGILIYGGGATITGNNVTTCEIGVDTEDPLTSMGLIANNNFSGDQSAVVNDAASSVSALNNWWGDVSGPVNVANPGAAGATVSDNVIFSPWLGVGTDTSTAIGFQPYPAPVYYQPVRLVFSTQAGGAGINSVLSPQPVVQVIDSNGGVDTVFNGTVSIAIGANPSGGILAGSTTVTVVGGVASFSGLAIDKAGSYTLTASSSSPIATAMSNPFDVANPLPSITSLAPAWAVAGSQAFTLTVNGANFVYNSVVQWNGSPRTTTFVSPNQLTASIPLTDIASASAVSVTVVNAAPGGGASAPATFNVHAVPAGVYVNQGYTSSGANDGHLWGYDAFSTIQAGIDAVAAGGTVNVAAGTYAENVEIDQPLSLLGPNAAVNPNTGARVPEAVIVPATSDPNPYDSGSVAVVYVAADNVTVKGLTVDGNNPSLTSGILVGGVDVDAAEGIVSYEGVGSVTIANNIVKNTTYTGVDFYNYVNKGAPTSGNEITGNLFFNLGATNYEFGIGVLIYNNFYADVSSNVMTGVRLGIQTGNFYQANPGSVQYQFIHDNNITCGDRGIFHNLAYGGASTFTLSNNVITAWQQPGFETYNREWIGVLISSLQDSVSATAINNIIDASAAITTTSGVKSGYNVWNTPTTGAVLISGGAVQQANYGVWVNNWDGYNSQGSSTHATISGVDIVGASLAGVYAQDDPQSSNGSIVDATVTNTVISGAGVGVSVQGATAAATVINNSGSITGNGMGIAVDAGQALIQGNDLTGNTVAGIWATNGATVDAGDCGMGVPGLGTSTGGNNLTGYTGGNSFAIVNGGGTVSAFNNDFGANASAPSITGALSGTVSASQSGGLYASAPAGTTVQCPGEAANVSGANTLAGFIGLGGAVSATAGVTVSYQDSAYPEANGPVTRTYTLTPTCGNAAAPAQTITVQETTPPTVSVKATLDAPLSATAPGGVTVNAQDVDAGSASHCSSALQYMISESQSGPWTASLTYDCSQTGLRTVYLQVTDAAGLSSVSSSATTVNVRDVTPPTVVFNSITVQLDATGNYTLTPIDVTAIANGSSDNCSIAGTTVSPSSFTFCDAGAKQVTLTVTDGSGLATQVQGNITVKAPANPPANVYVDASYGTTCGAVTFPKSSAAGTYYVGYNAFNTIQAALNKVATGGTVTVAAGTYNESPEITQPVTLSSAGGDSAATTVIVLQPNAPQYLCGITIGASDVTLEGFTVAGFDAAGTGLASSDIVFPTQGIADIMIANNVIEVGASGSGTDGDDGFGIINYYETTAPYLDRVTISGNTFKPVDAVPAGGAVGAGFYINPGMDNLSVTNNTFLGDLAPSGLQAMNAIVVNNTVTGSDPNGDTGGFFTWGYPDATVWGHATFRNNNITGTGTAIALYDSQGVVVENNILTGNGTGVSVQDYSLTVDAGTDQIINNSLAGDTVAGVDNEAANGAPTATGNWWGDLSGPYSATLNPYGTGSAVIGNAILGSWLASGANSNPGIGFTSTAPANYPPAQLVFTTEPGGANLGSLLSPQPVVSVEDANGTVTPWAAATVKIAIQNNPTGLGVLTGTTDQPLANGVATFNDLALALAGGSGYTLVASIPNLPAVTSSGFDFANPAPALTSVSPFYVRAGAPDTMLTVNGSNFTKSSVVNWNSSPLATTYVSGTQLTATIPSADLASVGAAQVTVGTPAPSGGSSASATVAIVAATPDVVYVDAKYQGQIANTWVNWPYTGGGTNIIGYDAFATVQGGVNAVASGGTVNVAAGSYTEEVAINQPLELLGPNANVNPNTGTRVAEAVIMPDKSDPEVWDDTDVIVVTINASHVTIKGLTVDGYNPGLAGLVEDPGYLGSVPTGSTYFGSFFASGTNLFNAAVGIGDYTGDSSIRIEDNIIKDDAYAAVDLESDGPNSPPNTHSCIKGNLIENVDFYAEGYGFGVLLYNNYYAEINGNDLMNVAVGISPQSFFLANPGDANGQTICSNYVSASELGVWPNLVYGSASPFDISENTSVFAPTNGSASWFPAEWDAFEFTTIDGVNVLATNNTIIGSTQPVGYNMVGYNIWGAPMDGNVVIGGGSVSNVNYGVWVNNYDGWLGGQGPAGPTTATIAGVNITGASLAGVYVQDDPRASENGVVVQGNITGNTTISNSTIGVLVQGINAEASLINNSASITGNGVGIDVDTGKALIQGNDLTGNTVAGIRASNGAVVDAGNCTGTDVTGGLGISTGGNNLSGYLTGSAKAIVNDNTAGSPVVLAYDDNFGATAPSDIIPGAFSGAVIYLQAPAVIAPPLNVTLTCDSEVVAPATDLAGFLAQGGYYSASPAATAVTVTSSDNHPAVGNVTIDRTYRISDGCGNAKTVDQFITVSNFNLPVFTSEPANITQPTDPGLCTARVTVTPPVATGTCDGPDGETTVTVTGVRSDAVPSLSAPFTKGVTTIAWTAVDTYGNRTNYTQAVTVFDNQPPVFTSCAPQATSVADVTGYAKVPDFTTPGEVVVSDNCNGVTLNQVPPAGTPEFLGTHPVTIWAVDQSGNSNSCSTSFTVIYKNAPALTCAPDVTITTAQDKYPYATGSPTASSPNLPVTITYSDDVTGLTNCDSTGVIVRTWTATDASANVSTCAQTITVVDTNMPVFTYLPGNITVTNNPGQCSAAVSFTPTARDLGYFQGFENTNWISNTNCAVSGLDWNDGNSHVYRAASGTGGIDSPNGVAYAVIDSTVPQAGPDYSASGAYCNLGGFSSWDYVTFSPNLFNSPFGSGYHVSVDVYINLNDPAVTAATPTTGYGWDLSTAASDVNAGFLQDYIFHTAAYGPGGVVVGADNNSNDDPDARRNDLLALPNHAVLTKSGWYKFEWNFYPKTDNTLGVDLTVRDTKGMAWFSETLSNPTGVANVDGRPNYTWFTFVFDDQLPIANTSFARNEPVISDPASGSAFPVGTTAVNNTATDACGNSTNTTFNVTVVDASSTILATSASTTTYGSPATFTATVSSCPATPSTGNVAFMDGNTILGTVPNLSGQATFTTSQLAAGLHSITAVYSGDSYYTPSTSGAVSQTVNPAALTVTGLTANSKVYDGTTSAALNLNAAALIGVAAGDTITLNTDAAAGAFANPDIGTDKPVTISGLTIGGSDLTNYTLIQPVATAAITPASLTITANSTSKVYGHMMTFRGTEFTTSGLINGDSVSSVILASAGANASAVEGSYPIDISTAVGTGLNNYTIAYHNGVLTVVAAAPVVVSLTPASQTNNATTTATFTVLVSGSASFTNYQWVKITSTATNSLTDGGNISGSTSSVLSIANVLAPDQAEYAVTVTNPTGSATTNGSLVVIDPAILTPPTDATVAIGGTASFNVTAAGSGTMDYQWQQNGVNLPGQTSSTLILNNISDSEAGSYTVTVSNLNGIVTSSAAVLTILHPPVFVMQPGNLVVNQGGTATFNVSVSGRSPFSYQWYLGSTAVTPWLPVTGDHLTINNAQTVNAGNYTVQVTNSDGEATSAVGTLTVIVPPEITGQPTSLTNNAGTVAVFSVTNTGNAVAYSWHKNATNLLVDADKITGSSTATLTISNVLGIDIGTYSVTISNSDAMVSSSAYLMVIDPIITNEPVSITNNAGTSASFTVSAYGTAPVYQWLKDGTVIPGATAATYTIPSVADVNIGGYSVVVSNAFGTVTSAPPSTLTVIDPPVITFEPQSLTVNATSNATFSVTFTGTLPVIQWYRAGQPINGATAATLTLNNVSQADAVNYAVVLTNAAGSVTSSPAAHLTVIDGPVITSQPTSLTNNAGTTAIFSVTKTGSASTYLWFFNGTNALMDGGKITGADSATLTITNVTGAEAGAYSVVVSNSAGVQTSASANLVVIDPFIVSQPAGVTNFDNTTVSFTVTAAGAAPLSYQWYQDGYILDGSTNSSLSLANIQDDDEGEYTVVITNMYGNVTSTPAALVTVLPLIVAQPGSVVALQGDPVSFSVSVNGATPFSYRWLQNGTNVPGGNGRILSFPNVTLSNAGSYQVYVTNPNGTEASDTATLSVYTSAMPELTLTYVNPVATVALTGVPTFAYAVQTSTNMLQWAALQTNLSPFTITVTNSAATPKRFFRGLYLHE